MTKQQWLAQVAEHRETLLSLVETYHPASHAIHGGGRKPESMPITAPTAEAACENVRQVIAARERNRAAPRERFEKALRDGDWIEINSLLNSAWFGVPESTACWQVEGFKEAVDLMEDLPEDEEGREATAAEDEGEDAPAF